MSEPNSRCRVCGFEWVLPSKDWKPSNGETVKCGRCARWNVRGIMEPARNGKPDKVRKLEQACLALRRELPEKLEFWLETAWKQLEKTTKEQE